MPPPPSRLKTSIAERIAASAPFGVWTPIDFLDLGDRATVDKALQRLAQAGEIRRIERGLYDQPRTSNLTGAPTVPDYRRVVEALTRRDQTRMLVDGMTAANDLGLTDAVPARVVVHTDARRRTIRLGNLAIEFKKTAPSRLHWAGRPAMRVVQALHWLKDMLPTERARIVRRLRTLLEDRAHGAAIRDDLRQGLATLPTWMQGIVRELLDGGDDHQGHDRSGDHEGQDDRDDPNRRPSGASDVERGAPRPRTKRA
ncbi:MAG: DUF6088 family protein [Gemmatimonadaceae bacterium]